MLPRGPLREGEAIILLDRKEREYLRRLNKGREISIRGGKIAVEDLIGQEDGRTVRSSMNESFVVVRPTLAQLIPQLPRKAQVIYPKDIALILIWADIFPGAKVIEAGVGPGALTLALLPFIWVAAQPPRTVRTKTATTPIPKIALSLSFIAIPPYERIWNSPSAQKTV